MFLEVLVDELKLVYFTLLPSICFLEMKLVKRPSVLNFEEIKRVLSALIYLPKPFFATMLSKFFFCLVWTHFGRQFEI